MDNKINITHIKKNNQFPERKHPRAYFHNYSGGDYFVTICTYDKQHFFGKIKNCEITYSEIGKQTNKILEELETHYPYMEMRQFVVMPNHVHAVIRIDAKECNDCLPKNRSALSVVVGGFKQAVTMYARKNEIPFFWQKGYHDRIIRHNDELNRISEYIANNIGRWEKDCFNNTTTAADAPRYIPTTSLKT